MLNEKDIKVINCDDLWIEDGIEYALISWISHFNRMGKANPYTRMEKIIMGVAAEHALEYCLKENKVKCERHGKTAWYEEDRYDIGVKNYIIDSKANLLQTKVKAKWLLDCTALVPLDQFNPGSNERRKDLSRRPRNKVYLFPFVHWKCHHLSSQEELFTEENDYNKRMFIVHAPWDYRVLKKGEHKDDPDLGNIEISSSCDNRKEVKLLLYGTTAKQKIKKEFVSLKGKKSVKTKYSYRQLFSIKLCGDTLPKGSISLYFPGIKFKEIIESVYGFDCYRNSKDEVIVSRNGWQNIWHYDVTIYVTGYVKDVDLRLEGKKYPRFTHTIKQYAETKVDNWGIEVSKLKPVYNLKTE